MAAKPPLSVFTTFHRPDRTHLDEAIRSVLAQTFGDFEYLLVSDGDPAEAKRLAGTFRDPRIRIIENHERIGLMRSRQLGVVEARGDLIAILDADDFAEPLRFERQIEFLRNHPEHVLVGSALRYVDDASRTIGQRRYPESDEEIRRTIVEFNCIAQPAVMARRRALLDAGNYTPEFEWAEDYDLWLRVSRVGKLHNLPEPLTAYRIHRGAGKYTRLKRSLRDIIRLKIHATRKYGYPLTPRVALNIAMHCALVPLPTALVVWAFQKVMGIESGHRARAAF
jgi:glycosyltransferase involved in cell wall biosynthesis